MEPFEWAYSDPDGPSDVVVKRELTLRGVTVGWIEGPLLYKDVKGSRHFLRKPKAIAFQDCVLKRARELNVVLVKVRDTEAGEVYIAPLASLSHDKYGFAVNRGHGEQTAMRLSCWDREGEEDGEKAG